MSNTCKWLQGPDPGFNTELKESDDDNAQGNADNFWEDEDGLSGNEDNNDLSDDELSDDEGQEEENSAAKRPKIYKTGVEKTRWTTEAAVHRAACAKATAEGMRKRLTDVSC